MTFDQFTTGGLGETLQQLARSTVIDIQIAHLRIRLSESIQLVADHRDLQRYRFIGVAEHVKSHRVDQIVTATAD